MDNSEVSNSQSDSVINDLMRKIEKAREENQTNDQINKTTPAKLPNEKKELHQATCQEGQTLIPRMGPRTREEKITAYNEEIKRIQDETLLDQRNLDYYETQQLHYQEKLAKLRRESDPDSKRMSDVLDELDRIEYEMFAKFGTAAEQTIRKKLRLVRIENIASQLFLLSANPPHRLSQDIEAIFPDNEDHNATYTPGNSWALDDTFAASPSPSCVSVSSNCRPWLRDHPASEVSVPISQTSVSGSLPRLQPIKGKDEALQEKFKRMQRHFMPPTTTGPVSKFRTKPHHRSSSITKLDSESSSHSSAPRRPTPVCPVRSNSLTGPHSPGSGNRDSLGERLSTSVDKGGSFNSSEDRRQVSLYSGVSDATDEMPSNGPYSPARLSITDSDNTQDVAELVQSILAKFDTNDHESFSLHLQSVTLSPHLAKELYKKGVMGRSIRLLHGLDDTRRFVFHSDIRERLNDSLYKIVRCVYHTEKVALQIYHNVSRVRDQCQGMMLKMETLGGTNQSELKAIRENISTSPFIYLNSFSSKSENIGYLNELGVLYAVSEYLVVDQRIVERLDEKYEPTKLVNIRRLVCAVLRNMTYRDPKNKVSICLLPEAMESLIAQLQSDSDALLNSTASLLRNLSWNAEDVSKIALNKCSAVIGLVEALQRDIRQDSILANITNGLINLTKHSPDNKLLFCAANFAIHYMIRFLSYKSQDGNSMVIENITGLFCNVSQHIASTPEHVKTIQEQGALRKLVDLLSSENSYVLIHVCGILNNLTFSNSQNVRTLWNLGAPQFLEKLKISENYAVSERAEGVLQRLVSKFGTTDYDFHPSSNGMESVQDASLFEEEFKSNFDTESEPSPVHRPNFEVTKVRVKDGMNATPVKAERTDEDFFNSNEKNVRKSKDGSKRGFLKKLSFIMKNDNMMENNRHSQEIKFSLNTSPRRPNSTESDTRSGSGSQSSGKTLVPNANTPQNSPRGRSYLPNPYAHTHPEAYSRMMQANDIMAQYPYANSYQSYPHHLIDMPPQPPLYPGLAHSPYVGYMHPHPYIPDYHYQPQAFHPAYYSPRGSPRKHAPHMYGSPPLRPNHFSQPHGMPPYRPQPQRLPTTNPNPNQMSRRDADILKSRLDKDSKDRSYTDSQGDLVTDL